VEYYRNSSEGGRRPTDAVVDAWLLKQFPGRTLDELDGMDYARYLRALEAQDVAETEQLRRLYLKGEIDADKQSGDVWESIKAHDELLGLG
jgi:hypothetical protein